MCYFWRLFRNISERQLNKKHFCDNFLKQSKVQLLTRLRPGVSHLLWAQLKHSFQDSLSLFSNCRAVEIEFCFQCFQRFKCLISNASNESLLPLNSLKRIDSSTLSQNYSEISWIYLPGDTNFNISVNSIILNAFFIKY